LLYEKKLKQTDSDRKLLVERLKKLKKKEAINKEKKKAKVRVILRNFQIFNPLISEDRCGGFTQDQKTFKSSTNVEQVQENSSTK